MGKDRPPAIPIRSFPRGRDTATLRYHTAPFRHGWQRALLLGLVVSVFTIAVSGLGIFREFELRTVDARFRFRGPRPIASPIAVVFIGDDSIAEFGRWPWSWDHHALMVDVLQRAGAKAILFDVFFTESPGAAEAGFFGEVARRAGNVYFCSFFDKFELPGGSGSEPLLEGVNLTHPVPELTTGTAGTGHCNALPDIDGNTRRLPLIVRHGDEKVPALLLRVAGDILGAPPEGFDLSPDGDLLLATAGGSVITVPVDGEGQTAVNFAGGLEVFPNFSYRQVLQADGYPDRAAVDLDLLRDKIVLVGVTYTGNTDLRPTPLDPVYPMIAIQATMLDNLLREEFIHRPPAAFTYLLWCFLGTVVGGVAFAFRPMISFGLMLLAGGAYLGAVAGLFNARGWQLELVGPLAAVFLAYLLVTTLQYIETRQEKLRYLERMKYLGHLVDSAGEAIISCGSAGQVMSWNHGAEMIYGYSEAEALGRRWTFIANEGDRELLESLLESTLAGEEVQGREMSFKRSDGTSIPVSVSFSQIRNTRGEVVGVSLISQDLSEKKKMIEALIRSEKLAEIGRMGSGIVHEIKNPLTSIMMMSSILSHDEGQPEKARRYSNIIEKECQRILRLSQNILSFARPKKAEMKDVDLNGILEETLELVEYDLKKAKVEVVRELEGGALAVHADREKLKQVFLNIITNAGHAMAGGGKLTVRTLPPGSPAVAEGKAGWEHCIVGKGGGEGLVVAQIEDEGPGISTDLLEKIFEPFFSTKDEGKGTGLGLYISRNIVIEHNGGLEARSKVGEGTVFTVHLPAGDAATLSTGGEEEGAAPLPVDRERTE